MAAARNERPHILHVDIRIGRNFEGSAGNIDIIDTHLTRDHRSKRRVRIREISLFNEYFVKSLLLHELHAQLGRSLFFIQDAQELALGQDRHAQRLCLGALRSRILPTDHVARLFGNAT